jgi:hypothetical protein
MDDFYWELTLMNKDKILIPPEYVATVKRKWAAGEQITTSRQVVPAHQIVNFEQTSRRRAGANLIEQASQAFKEPIIRTREFSDGTTDEAVATKWVKKQITQREWEKYYAPHNYKRIWGEAGIVVVAFRCPTHLIDVNKVQYCTADEVEKLTS